jgi:hypothetical protein
MTLTIKEWVETPERKCDCCVRMSKEISVHASSLGPFSFGYCIECDKNRAEPADVLENIVKNRKCIHGTRAEGIRKYCSVYIDGDYVKMQKFLDDNQESFITKYDIPRDQPTFAERALKEFKDKNEGPFQ